MRFVEEVNSRYEGDEPALVERCGRGLCEERWLRSKFSNLQDLGQNAWNITHKNAIHRKMPASRLCWPIWAQGYALQTLGIGLQGNGGAGELVGVFFTDHDQRYSSIPSLTTRPLNQR